MSRKKPMKTYSADELNALITRGEDRSDLAHFDAMTNADVDKAIVSDHDDDVSLDWSKVSVTLPRTKQGVFLRLDPVVLDYFRAGGAGYQTRINAVLRAYIEQMRVGNKKRAV